MSRSSKQRDQAGASKFDRLISALCQEHYDCLRLSREEGLLEHRLTTGSQLWGSEIAGGDSDFWPQPLLTVPHTLSPGRVNHRRHTGSCDASVQSAASASWGSEKSIRFINYPTNDEDRTQMQHNTSNQVLNPITLLVDDVPLRSPSLTSSSHGKNYELRLGWEQDWDVAPSTYSVMSGIQIRQDSDAVEIYKYKDMADVFVLHPNSRKRVAWNMICFLFIVSDIIIVPLQAAWTLEGVKAIDIADWASRSVWTFDMVVSCFGGFYLKGRLHMSFKSTWYHYVTTWFVLDLLLVVSDWVLYFMISETSRGYGKMLRFARSARIIRLLRLFKLRGLLHAIEDIIDTENVSIYFQCVKPLLAVSLLTHVFACGWFGIGVWDEGEYRYCWVEYSGVLDRSQGYQYATSMHWSLAQFTLNSMDVYAHNLGERFYTIAVGLFGIIGFSVLVSGFTSAAEQLREIKSDETKQFWMLRRFFRDYAISHKLASRVMRYCEHTYTVNKARIQPEDVSLMKLLSQPLRQELGMEINLPQLIPHPLFLKMQQLRYVSLKTICLNLSPRSYARGDSFVTKGEDSIGMIMLTEGEASYTYSDVNCRQCQRLESGEWLCEPSLWTYWTALGNAKAEFHSRVLVVLSDMFERVFSSAPFTERMHVQRYAQKFVVMLNSLSRDSLTDIIDPMQTSETPVSALPEPHIGIMEFFVKNLAGRLSARSSQASSGERTSQTLASQTSQAQARQRSSASDAPSIEQSIVSIVEEDEEEGKNSLIHL